MNVCPTTTVELQAASAKQNCTRIKVYHCLRNQNRQLTQKCIKSSWIQSGLCAEYNTIAERLDAKPCKTTQGICPQKAYLSNDVISYSACAPDQYKSVAVINSTLSSNQVESSSSNLKLILPSIIIPVALIIIITTILLYLRKRKRGTQQGKPTRGIEAPEEETELLDKKAEIRDYLKRESEKLEFFVDDERYVPVCELDTVRERILGLSHVAIVGKPGIGKTSLSWNLCKNLHGSGLENKTCIIKVIERDIPEIELEEDERIILLLDNYLENASSDTAKEKLRAIEKAYHDMLSNQKMVLILTVSHFDYNRISKILRKVFAVVQIRESTIDMGKILRAHGIGVHEIKQERTLCDKQFIEILDYVREEKPWFRQPVPIGFPLIASLASINDKFLNEFKTFSAKPRDTICDLVWKLSDSGDSVDKSRFCSILYAAFKGGRINPNLSNPTDEELFNSIATFHKVTNAVLEIDNALFRKKADGNWEIYHESILRMLLSKYGEKQPNFLFSKCPLRVLLRYCTLKKGEGDERNFLIVIEKIENLKRLISRIKMEAVDIDIESHSMWESERFRNLFLYGDKKKKMLK